MYACLYVYTYISRSDECMYVRIGTTRLAEIRVPKRSCGLPSHELHARSQLPGRSLGDAWSTQRGQRGGSSPWNSPQSAVIQHHQACRIFTQLTATSSTSSEISWLSGSGDNVGVMTFNVNNYCMPFNVLEHVHRYYSCMPCNEHNY